MFLLFVFLLSVVYFIQFSDFPFFSLCSIPARLKILPNVDERLRRSEEWTLGVTAGRAVPAATSSISIEYFLYFICIEYFCLIFSHDLIVLFYHFRLLEASSEIVGRRCSRWPPTDLTKSRNFCQEPKDIWKKKREPNINYFCSLNL